MAKKKVKAGPKDLGESKLFAFLGVFLTIIGFIIVILTKKDNKYAMYYAKQGLVLFIAAVVLWVVNWVLLIFALVSVIGMLISLIMGLLWIVWLILWFIGWINALSGKEKPLPLIGQFADKFNF